LTIDRYKSFNNYILKSDRPKVLQAKERSHTNTNPEIRDILYMLPTQQRNSNPLHRLARFVTQKAAAMMFNLEAEGHISS
jgi:hypothetical protein